jgi:sporadic carbohydrate cluster protein (TIGR04323 family)
MVLEGMIQDLTDYEGIVLCSMHMLPQRAERRRQIYERILKQGCSLHIVLEGIVISGPQDVEKIEELLQLNQIAARLPKDLQVT